MSDNNKLLDIPTCIICRLNFNCETKLPCTQYCQHSICKECINNLQTKTIVTCPFDNKKLGLTKSINIPLARFIYNTYGFTCGFSMATENIIEKYMEDMVELLTEQNSSIISPQLSKRLLHLIESTPQHSEGLQELLYRLSSVFQRLMLELVQVQHNTKQREQVFVRLIKSKGCSIDDPFLTDLVIDLLIKLYQAADHYVDTSFERNVLVKFLLKELAGQGYSKRQIEKVIQTLYKTSCFQIIEKDGSPARLKLEVDLQSSIDLRLKYDSELVRIALENKIRLSPQSWAYLLHGRNDSETVSMMQSIVDKYHKLVNVEELNLVLTETGDKYGIGCYLNELQQVQDLISSSKSKDGLEIIDLVPIFRELVKLKHLFMIRQRRCILSQ